MGRPRNPTEKTSEQIRDELIADLNECSKVIPKKHPPMKNIYNYHPDCPYADRNTGIVLESYYQYWRFYPKDIIQPDETIKHMNNDRTDNDIKNLVKWKKQIKPDCPIDTYMLAIKRADRR